jgi:hypothetical protein
MSTTLAITFSALAKGERFRIWRSAVNPGGIGWTPQLSPTVYTKVSKQVCKLADGQWVTIQPSTLVEREPAQCDKHLAGFRCQLLAGHDGPHDCLRETRCNCGDLGRGTGTHDVDCAIYDEQEQP